MATLCEDRFDMTEVSAEASDPKHAWPDAFEWGVFGLLLVLSVLVSLVLFFRQGPNAIWLAVNGTYISDQLNYLGWIQVAARHLLISNPFTTAPTTADYLNPGLAISGLLTRAGVSPYFAYLVWEPVAVVVIFEGSRRYIRALVEGVWARRAALVLALLYIAPAAALVSWLNWPHWTNFYLLPAVDVEMWPVGYLWGYPFTAIAVGLMALCLLSYAGARRLNRPSVPAPALAFFCAWLQPWQGATLGFIIVVSELLSRKRGDRTALSIPAATLIAILIPLSYYSALSHFDPSWAEAGRANLTIFPNLPWQPILVSILPMALVGALVYRLPVRDFSDLALRSWPVAALCVYVVIAVFHVGTFPLHSLQGVGIPLAIMAVRGAQSLRFARSLRLTYRPLAAVIATLLIVLLVVPSGARQIKDIWNLGSPTILGPQPYFITHGDRDALTYLRNDKTSGSVLAQFYLGQTIPAETGRQTWLGSYSWTPDFFRRISTTNNLFAGKLSPVEVDRVVRSSSARFVLSACNDNVNIAPALHSMLRSVRHFGCATVYELKT